MLFILEFWCCVLLLLRQCRADTSQLPLSFDTSRDVPVHRVAIIGAGAAGSSAAYHLSKFSASSDHYLPINITVFETSSRVGGRTTTVNALDDPRYPTELGASIFVEVNHILFNATRDFNLDTRSKLYETTGSKYELGVWDGRTFAFKLANNDADDGGWRSRWWGYWDIAKLLWRYGVSPIWTRNEMRSTVGKFLEMYDKYFPFEDLNQATNITGLVDYVSIPGIEALARAGISEKFSREIVQASTRVNYAQDLNHIHGLETMVCMATEGGMAVEGGNWQIFNEAVKRSGAVLHLNTSVTDVYRTSKGTYQLESTSESLNTNLRSSEFDSVILAAPYQFSNLSIYPPLKQEPEPIDYVSLHVTLFTSPHRPSPSSFHLSSEDELPDTILTTLPEGWEPSSNPRDPTAVGPMKFWSISTLRTLNPDKDVYPAHISDEDLVTLSKKLDRDRTDDDDTAATVKGTQYLYKIFSPAPLTTSFLCPLFNFTCDHILPSESISSLPKNEITWSHEKKWHSYPYLPATSHFPDANFRLCEDDDADLETRRDDDDVSSSRNSDMKDSLDSHPSYPRRHRHSQPTSNENQDDKKGKGNPLHPNSHNPSFTFGIYYTSPIERFISTMETSALSGMNVARLIIDGLEAIYS